MSKKYSFQNRKRQPKPNFLKKIGTKSRKNDNSEIKLGEEIKKTGRGYISFAVPRIMQLGKVYPVVAEIRKDRKFQNTDSTTISVFEIELGARMSTKITGSGFDIVVLNNEDQATILGNRVMWHWNTKPLETGEKDLHLQVSVRLDIGGREEFCDNPVQTIRILVKANRLYSIKMLSVKYGGKLLRASFLSGLLKIAFKIFRENFK